MKRKKQQGQKKRQRNWFPKGSTSRLKCSAESNFGENINEKGMRSYNRSKGMVCAKKREGLPVIKR